jgi:alpha-glucoside transport system substrate-binding protein
MMKRSKRLRLLAGSAALAMIVAACGGDDATDGTPSPAPSPAPAPSGDAGELTILHAFTGDEDTAGLRAMIAAFNEQHPDILVREEGTGDFESLARTRIGAGTPSDIILHPQPGLLKDFVDQGVVTPLDDLLDVSRLENELVGGLLDLSTFDGSLYAIPMRLSVKSLVWYNPAVFEANSYAIPSTWDEMIDLSDQMVADGITPWCIGIESGDATGWVATDWVEDILLRTIGGDEYDRWVAGELGFASPEVQGAIEEYMVPIWTNDDYVFGGRAQIAREAFGTSVSGILGDDPECGMHRQATFIEGFITEVAPDAEFGVDYDFFYLPAVTAGDRPVLGAGDYAALYTDNPAAVLFMEFLATAESGEGWAARGGFLSPFAPVFDSSVYPTDSSVRASEILAEATAFRFDGSDLMPGDVGSSSLSGSFWSEMTSWVLGEKSLTEALEAIDAFYASIS